MSETKIDERGASGEVVDYSRPVGWWCPVCQLERPTPTNGCLCNRGIVWGAIPVYLPIPEGQRPPAASEVEEAEVVTWDAAIFSWHSRPNRKRKRWVISVETDAERHINYIVTGATE